jgi:hypothetical protein
MIANGSKKHFTKSWTAKSFLTAREVGLFFVFFVANLIRDNSRELAVRK